MQSSHGGRALEEARERIAKLQDITAALSRARTAADVADVTCTTAARAMDAQSGVLWLVDENGTLVMAGSWGIRDALVEQFRVLPLGDRSFAAVRVAHDGVPVYIENGADWRRSTPEELHEQLEAQGRVLAYAALPLVVEERVQGVIIFGHPLGHRYDDADRVFYETVALHCGQALERARLLDEARAARDAAFRANRAKDEFLAMLGHELRNPLAPIVTALELIAARGPTPFEKERAVIDRQIQHLGRLVDDLLDVARITAGRIQLTRTRLALDEIIAHAVEMTRPLLDERRHELTVQVVRGLDVDGDPTRLAQVITNLLTNASKYTPPGGRVRVTGTREGGEVVLRVEDSGMGMSVDLAARVFDLFEQGPQALHRPQGGLGLGLAIVKSLVALHGGTVSAHSDGPRRGSVFVVRLPALLAATEETAAAVAAQLAPGGRVLVVDDNHDAAELLAAALSILGYTTEIAYDGHAALAAAAQFSPQVAVLDLGLPLLDGYEVGRRLRALPAAPRLIALTGYGQDSDRKRTKEAGFDAHLVKPVDMSTLEAELSRLLA